MWCSEFPVPDIPEDSAPEKEEKMPEYGHVFVSCCIQLHFIRGIWELWDEFPADDSICGKEKAERKSSKSRRRGEQDEVWTTHFHYPWIQWKAPCGHEIWLYQYQWATTHHHLTLQPSWYTEAKDTTHKRVHTQEGRWFDIPHQIILSRK